MIITDTIYSSNLFTYTCGDLEWSTTGNRPAVVGYNAGGTYFENHRSSGFDTVANDVSCVVEVSRSKRQAAGNQAMFHTKNRVGAMLSSSQACRKRYNKEKSVKFSDLFSEPAQACPQTLRQAIRDSRFKIDMEFRNAADATCYIQRFSVSGLTGIKYGQQCCYDKIG